MESQALDYIFKNVDILSPENRTFSTLEDKFSTHPLTHEIFLWLMLHGLKFLQKKFYQFQKNSFHSLDIKNG